ncbi:MAG: hypothetical protein J5805_07810 [Bacteroidaceae bacterium]|nr:hypothetical protein [Bacteroidaceae bacterium]
MDTIVIIIMIICATVVALVAIICDHLFERKTINEPESFMSKKIIKVHRNYIAGILGFSIIMLITAKYGGPNNAIFAYLSFGSTITSLVLSILAIFVTVQSSSDLYKQFTKIENATETIKNVSNQIDTTLIKLTETELNLTNTSNTITTQMDEIVMRIDERMKERMKETEHTLLEQINMLNNQFTHEGSPADEAVSNQAITGFINNLKKYFLNSCSPDGLLAIYACFLSKKHDKEFVITDMFKGNEQYTYGFLVSSHSNGMITIQIDNFFKVKCINTIFSIEELNTRLKEIVKNLDTFFLDRTNFVNRFFGEPEITIK